MRAEPRVEENPVETRRSRIMTGKASKGVFLAVVLVCTLLNRGVAAQEPVKPPVEPPKNNQYALLVGCTEYPILRKLVAKDVYENSVLLRGPANDAELMKSVLTERMGFSPNNITTLAGWPKEKESRPTQRNILSQLASLAKRVKDGDMVVLLFAGHGVQQPDQEGDEVDGLDEVFLPADAARFESSQGKIPGAISDDEIGRRVRSIREAGALVWIIMDTCHSGTMVRGGDAGARFRQIEPSLLGVPQLKKNQRKKGRRRGRKGSMELEGLDGIAAFYAAQSFHKAPELPLPREDPNAKYHGLLTFMIARKIMSSPGDLSYQELFSSLVAGYHALPYEGTVPIAEGDLSRTLGGRSRQGPVLLLRREDDELILNAGSLAGIQVGTELFVLPPGRVQADPVGRARVVSTDPVSSVCLLSEGSFDDPLLRHGAVFPAAVAERPVGDLALRLCLVNEQGAPQPLTVLPAAARRCLADCVDQFPLGTAPTRADWLLVTDKDRLWLRPTLTGSGGLFSVDPKRLDRGLSTIFRSHHLKSLAVGGIAPGLDPRLRVEMWRVLPSGAEVRCLTGDVLRPGEKGRLTLKNDTGDIYDVTVLHLDAHHGIQQIYPPHLRSPRLTHQDTEKIVVTEFWVTDRPVGFDHLIVIAVPREETEDPVDFSWVTQGSLRGGTRGVSDEKTGALSDVLAAMAFGTKTRGMMMSSDVREPSIGYLSWKTEWPELQLPEWGEDDAPTRLPRVRGLPEVASRPAPVPDPWSVGSRGILRSTGSPRGRKDLLLLGEESPVQIFLDLDDDTPLTLLQPEKIQDLIADRSFDAEIVVHFLPDRRIAYYDIDNDGNFDQALVDRNRDQVVDQTYVRTDEGWTEKLGQQKPWLSTLHFKFPLRTKELNSVIQKLGFLAGSEAGS